MQPREIKCRNHSNDSNSSNNSDSSDNSNSSNNSNSVISLSCGFDGARGVQHTAV